MEKAKTFFAILGLGITIGVVTVVVLVFVVGAVPHKVNVGGVEFEIPTPTVEATSTTLFQAQPSQVPSNSSEVPAVISEPVVVSVSATKGWQGTGIIINVGDDVKIRYREGSWLSVKGETFFGPDPTFAYETLDKCFPLPKAPGALIGMIGNYEPFKIGYSYETTSNVYGELFMRMNDCDQWLFDNKDELEGGIRVIVGVVKP